MDKKFVAALSTWGEQLERIAELEQRNESLEEKARQWDMHNCTTHAMNLAQKNRNLEQQLGETNEALAACQSEAGGLLAENERLRASAHWVAAKDFRDAGFKQGMERAAEVCDSLAYEQAAKAIRAELDDV